MTWDQLHQFADDAPRSNPWSEDTLGFAPFSRRLAEALARQSAPNGYVFGLHGEWGSGKSTVLNFVRSHFQKWREEESADVDGLDWFSFEPWIVSGHQDLAAAFFKVMSEHLSDGADRKASIRRVAKSVLEAGGGKIVDAAASLGVVIDHTGGTASKVGATLAKQGLAKAAEKWLSEPSVQKIYDELVIRLRASRKRFIVFVDDIDRLTSTEIRSLMQMVKTVGRLPNVTYCLSYDRQIVWAALEELAPREGARSGYAEKIVQHEAEVPVPSRTGLMRMLDASLPELPGTPTGARWIEMVQVGLNRWIRHPRDVVRLSNAMHFALAALKDEVDSYDVLCMEAMRLFDRKLFEWVRDNRDLLLGEGYPAFGTEDEKEAAADELGRTLSEDSRADAIPMLRLLFPNRSNVFGRRPSLSHETWNEAAARRGLATKAGYTAYFSLSPSPYAVPRAMVELAAGADVTREKHREYITHAIGLRDEQGASLVGEYFQELGYRLHTLSPDAKFELFKALVDESVAVYEANSEAGTFGPASAHHVLVNAIMSTLGPGTTGDVVADLFATSEDAGALSALYVDLARSLGVMKTDGASRRDYMHLESFEALGPVLLPKIEAAAKAGQLTALPHYYEVARAWSHLGGAEEARAWLANEARRNGHTLAKLSKGMLGSSHDGTTTRFGVYRSVESDFYELYDLDAIEEGCRAFIDSEDLNDIERARIRALSTGLASLSRAKG
ncbi:P-loop NTPase fold protein [Croceibacterium sp. TMG7-5b_MA50]|uniref:KAP family P-loop NTPase fold protein n=1 Tax=Croceibacterium sp. TMG7-5b_MA50 TaxID=3121290 RepID=UPI003222106A